MTRTSFTPAGLVLLAITSLGTTIVGCASTVGPRGDAAPGSDAMASDAQVQDVRPPTLDEGPMSCTFADGRRCTVGTSCPAGDGCNTCTCQSNGMLSCTLLGCAPAPCRSTADCTAMPGLVCAFRTPGCSTGALGVCEPMVECPIATPFCGCDGVTHLGPCNGPDAQYVATGECAVGTDAGTAPADCNPSHVACPSLPPACSFGLVPEVIGACWGPCIAFSTCAPIPCDPATTGFCPASTSCDATTGQCRIMKI